jgi:hypothetical protein
MKIVERRQGGYLIECSCARGGHFFQHSPALSVECPCCGRTQILAELVTTWVIARQSAVVANASVPIGVEAAD